MDAFDALPDVDEFDALPDAPAPEAAPSIPAAPKEKSKWERAKEYLAALQRGIESGATYGFRDEIAGAAGALGGMAGGDPRSMGEVYREARDENRAESDAMREEHPNLMMAGEVGGSLLALPATGLSTVAKVPQSGLLRSAVRAIGGGDRTRKLLAAGEVGAKAGVLAGAGESRADTLGGVAADAAWGGATGGAFGAGGVGIGEGVGAGLRKAGPWLEDVAGEKAFKAIGGIQGDIRSAISKSGVSGGLPRVREAGRDLRKLGVATALVTPRKAEERIAGQMDVVGHELGKLLPELDEKIAAKGLTGKVGVNVLEIMDRAQREIIDPLRASPVPELKAVADQVERTVLNLADETAKTGSGVIPFARAHAIRQEIDKPLFWNNRNPAVSLPKEYARQLRSIVSDQLGLATEAAGRVLGAGNEGARWSALNRLYSSLAIGEKAAESGAIRAAGNSSIGLKDAVLASAGAASGGLPLALAAGAGSKLLRTYGPGIQSSLAAGGARLARYPDAVSNAVRRGAIPMTLAVGGEDSAGADYEAQQAIIEALRRKRGQ